MGTDLELGAVLDDDNDEEEEATNSGEGPGRIHKTLLCVYN